MEQRRRGQGKATTMPPPEPLRERFGIVLDAVSHELGKLGYRRRGLSFRLLSPPMCGIVQFQRSSGNSEDRIKFTINVGVACGLILSSRLRLADVQVWDAHVQERLGSVALGHDAWWSVEHETDAAQLAMDLGELVRSAAVPFIAGHFSPDSLMKLWESGVSPGLTGVQRERLLGDLQAALALVGRWRLDRDAHHLIERFGDIVLDFHPDGELTYLSPAGASAKTTTLRYLVEGALLVTDQLSSPRLKWTKFALLPDGVLTLELDDVPCLFVRC